MTRSNRMKFTLGQKEKIVKFEIRGLVLFQSLTFNFQLFDL